MYISHERKRIVLNRDDGKKEYFNFEPGTNSQPAASQKAEERMAAIGREQEAIVGRPLTTDEKIRGRVVCPDSRTTAEKISDSDWRPKLKDTESQIDRMIAEVDEEIEEKRLAKMSPLEMRRYSLEQKKDREDQEKLDNEKREKHLKKVGPKLDAIDQLIYTENFSPSSDEKFRSLLRRTREQLSHPDGDRVETLRLVGQVEDVLHDRRARELAAIEAEAEQIAKAHAANQAAMDSHQSLLDGLDPSNPGE